MEWLEKLKENPHIQVMHQEGSFAITSYGGTYITCFHNGVKIGCLSTNSIKNYQGKKYIMVNAVNLEKKYWGKRLGFQMYKALLTSTLADGIYTYVPNIVNKKQVPKIYNRLGKIVDGDFWYVNKP